MYILFEDFVNSAIFEVLREGNMSEEEYKQAIGGYSIQSLYFCRKAKFCIDKLNSFGRKGKGYVNKYMYIYVLLKDPDLDAIQVTKVQNYI